MDGDGYGYTQEAREDNRKDSAILLTWWRYIYSSKDKNTHTLRI